MNARVQYPPWQECHGTTHECKFLDAIGVFGVKDATRAQLLHRYRSAMARRDRWGEINREAVSAHLDKLIAIEFKGPAK